MSFSDELQGQAYQEVKLNFGDPIKPSKEARAKKRKGSVVEDQDNHKCENPTKLPKLEASGEKAKEIYSEEQTLEKYFKHPDKIKIKEVVASDSTCCFCKDGKSYSKKELLQHKKDCHHLVHTPRM